LVKLADGYYCQFCIDVNRQENITPSGNTIGLDVGLKEYYTDSNGVMIENPKRMFEKSLMVYQIFLDPPKSPLKRGTLTLVPPLARGVRGDL
jgi:transposase